MDLEEAKEKVAQPFKGGKLPEPDVVTAAEGAEDENPEHFSGSEEE